jgi:hypothetical protein
MLKWIKEALLNLNKLNYIQLAGLTVPGTMIPVVEKLFGLFLSTLLYKIEIAFYLK